MKLSKLAQTGLFLGAGFLYCSTTVFAQDNELNKVVKVSEQINESANKSQIKIDKLSEQISSKLQQFKTINKETSGLKIYNKQMNSQIESQLTELSQIANSMDQVSVIERQISPLMARMIETLSNFVALDIPFLPAERNKRITDLNSMIKRADVAVSEKFRRVLEAYQIEVDYGRTIEAYTGLLSIDGVERDVDFLRIGRISLVYQTRDGSHLGRWNNETKQWDTLSDTYRLDINKGLRIARKQLAPDLMIVPVSLTAQSSSHSAE
jgi:hypothetical protein